MGLKAYLFGGRGEKRGVNVSDEGAVHVIPHSHPPIDELTYPIPLSKFFENNSGSVDMRVSASLINPIPFKITSNNDFDIYIKSITIQISDAGASLDKFGNIPALTNGIRFTYKSKFAKETDIFQNTLKTNLEVFREATDGKGFGNTTNSWLADISGGGSDTYFPDIDISKRYGIPFGMRLRRGSSDFLSFYIQDDLTALDAMNAKAHGIII